MVGEREFDLGPDPFEPPALTQSERFDVVRPLGEGGMGRVYLVHDHKLDTRVALKTLNRVDPANLYRFKKEFRSLANVSHDNLVALHELVVERDAWFLTMEYVEGQEFLGYLHAREPGSWQDDDATIDSPPRAVLRASQPRRSGIVARLGSEGEAKLRDAFSQLALGVQALHEAGKLHKDLKPSNVLVTPQRRVVLLDFGMVDDWLQPDTYKTLDEGVFGTPAYMAPEQAAGDAVSRPSDWYSFGAMLYEAMTGELPFDGSTVDIVTRKQVEDPAPPSSLVAGLPRDLEELCMQLLRRDPGERPGGPEVLARMRPSMPPPPSATGPAVRDRSGFVGRTAELRALRDAFDATMRGQPVAVVVDGPSGIGKSTLVDHFIGLVEEAPDTVVLRGRCYERESVPFKAIDSLIDSLGRYLTHISPRDAASLLPRNAAALSRMFPVLRKVPAMARAPSRTRVRDLAELRRRGFGALKELLARISDRHALVITIDDVQWGDADSAALLAHVLGAPGPASMLVIATRRRDASGQLPGAAMLEGEDDSLDLRQMELGALAEEDACELARRQLDADREAEPGESELIAIARESGGSPFFVGELVRSLSQQRRSQPSAPLNVSLDRALGQRLVELPAGPRRLLSMVAVAGQPLPQGVALAAAQLSREDSTFWNALRSASFVSTGGVGADDAVDCLHQRVRDVAIAQLDAAEIRDCHGRLAMALRQDGRATPEMLAFHYERANEVSIAAEYVLSAARAANRALAFSRAAELYRWLLRISEADARRRAGLERDLGDALANAGRGAEAAEAYLRARDAAPRAQGLDLERLAAEYFLRSGHVEEGLESLERVLAAVGMKLPSTPARALASLLLRRGRLRLRGLRFAEREEQDVPADLLIRIDTCWTASSGLGLVDFVRGGDFQTRHLLFALEAGEPVRLVRALALEAGYLAAGGSKSQKQTARVVDQAMGMCDRLGDAHGQGLCRMAASMAEWHLGHWKRSVDLSAEAERIFRERCAGVTWEIATNHVFAAAAHYWLGDLRSLAQQGAEHLREAHENGDLFAASDLQTGYHVVPKLAADEPDSARAALAEEKQRWSHKGFHLQHWNHLEADCLIDLYEGEGEQAHTRVSQRWADLKRSLVLEVQVVRVEAHQLRAHAALAAAVGRTRGRDRLLAEARRAAAAIRREHLEWADGLADALGGAIHELRGEVAEACDAFERAHGRLKSCDMMLHAACAQYRLGRLVSGTGGEQQMAEAAAHIAAQGVVRPERMVATIAPGF